MTTSMFDPQSFLDAQITEVSVKRPPLTAGIEIIGVITEVAARTWTGKKDPSQSGLAIDVKVEYDLKGSYPAEAAKTGADKLILSDSIMLNLTDSGAIDLAPGKNARLRQYRDALDMNKAGEVFAFRAMVGRPIRTKIKHVPYNGDILDNIDTVAKP